MAGKLAMFGGPPAVPGEYRQVRWPVVTASDQEAVLRVLASGKFTLGSHAEEEIAGLEQEWAELAGTRSAVAVSNATCGLGLALAALGVQPGDEVVVPALSFVATAMAPLYQFAIPVFADIDPVTFNIDPSRLEAAITPRTRAVIPVHLHGLPADMERICAIAREHGLFVVEDAAQAQGARFAGRPTGSLGHLGVFSLNAEKNVPTCGELGLLTMDDPALVATCRRLRVLGEEIDGSQRLYVSHTLGWNHKPTSILAAFARSQLLRFPDYQARRERNVTRLLGRLSRLPGLIVPRAAPDRTHVWHILRFRFDPEQAGLAGISPGRFRQALQRALRAEGVPISQYQLTPLPGQPVFRERRGYGRGYPWTLPGVPARRYDIADYPQTLAVIEDSLTLRRAHLDPDAGAALERYADAFERVWEHLDVIARLARSLPYEPPWATVERRAEAGSGRAPGPTA